MSKCGVNVFKRKLDNFLSQVPDDPCETNSDNSIQEQHGDSPGVYSVMAGGLKINSLNRSSKVYM